MVDPGPAEEGRSLNLTLFNPEKDIEWGKRREKERGKKFHSKKKSFTTVTEKNGKLLRCPIDECPKVSIITQQKIIRWILKMVGHLCGSYQSYG